MPTKEYRDAITKFQNDYNFNFNPETYLESQSEMYELDFFGFGENVSKENKVLKTYMNTLYAAFNAYMEELTRMDAQQTYDYPDVSIGDFINGFEELMKEKYKSNLSENVIEDTGSISAMHDRREYESGDFEIIASFIMNQARQYNKTLPDIWAEKITKNQEAFDNLITVTNNSAKTLETFTTTDAFERGDNLVKDLITAKSAMEKVTKSRGFWWKLWIGNWKRNSQEKNYLKDLNSKIEAMKANGLTQNIIDRIERDNNRTLLNGAEERLAETIQAYKDRGKNEKATSAESANRLMTDTKLKNQFRDEVFKFVDNAPIVEGAKRPNVHMKTVLTDGIYLALMAVNQKMWKDFEQTNDPNEKEKILSVGARDLFKAMNMRLGAFQIKEFEKRIIAYQLTDMYLNKYSPVATDEKYAKYGDKYFFTIEPGDLYPIAFQFEGNTRINAVKNEAKILAEVRKALGIEKPVELPDFEADQKAYDETKKIKQEEDDKAQKENLQQIEEIKAQENKENVQDSEVKQESVSVSEEKQEALEVENKKEEFEEEFEDIVFDDSTNEKEPAGVKPEDLESNVKEPAKEDLSSLTFTERLNKVMEAPNFVNELMDMIMENIAFSPLPDDTKYSKAQENILQILIDSSVQICESSDDDANNSEEEIHSNMKYYAENIFENAFRGTEDFHIPMDKRLVAAQKMANYCLKKMHPVGFCPEKFGKYNNNLGINNDEIIEKLILNDGDYVSKSSVENINEAIKNAKMEFSREKININRKEIEGNEKAEVSKKHEDEPEKAVEKEKEKGNKKPDKKSKIDRRAIY